MSIYAPVFSALNETGARYVVVGGFATVLQGYARLTADVDLVVDLETKQATKVIGALTKLGLVPRAPVEAKDFTDPAIRRQWIEEKGMQVFTLWDRDNPMRVVDLFVEAPIDFDELYARSQVMELGELAIRVASIPDLIQLKQRSGRPKDIDDIEKLEQIEKLKYKAGDD